MEKNILKFDDDVDLADYLFSIFEEEDNITIIADLEYARIFAEMNFDDGEFTDYHAITIASDIDEYYISKIKDEMFCVEPCKSASGNYLILESNKVIMLRDLMNDDLLMAIGCDEFVEVSIEEASPCDDCECCFCDCDCECVEEEESAIDGLIDRYVDLIIDNDYSPLAIKEAFEEYSRILFSALIEE